MPLAEQVSTDYRYSQHVNPQSGDAGIRHSASNHRQDACYAPRFTDAARTGWNRVIVGMGLTDHMRILTRLHFSVVAIVWLATTAVAQTVLHEVVLNFVPGKAAVKFTLGASLHTVHGSFAMKSGTVHFDPATQKVSGEIFIDATSGQSGNDGRDRKMHKEVLESARYPEVVFRPDRVEGQFAATGASTLQVHGIFAVHGSEHEITIPVQVEMSPGHWTAASHFAVPYVKWGMKNPSTFILRVDQSVDIAVQASGDVP
jgi:polyisoprenoid-binding protein YceI